jgi:hypothetical protein
MRALSWLLLGGLAFACGGSAFSSRSDGEDGGGGAGAPSGGKAGTGLGGKPGSGGSNSAGSSDRAGHAGVAAGGNAATGGSVTTGGSVGEAGAGGKALAGATSTGGTSAGEAGAAGADGGEPIDETCPLKAPHAGGGCADGLVCTYGDDLRASCRRRAQCQAGHWTLSEPKCEALVACSPIVQGTKCDPAKAPPCTLEEHILCVCSSCGSGGPCASETVWKCAAGSGGQLCPKEPPNLGQSCSVNVTCPYGSCSINEGVEATCDGKTWAWESLICPL